MRPVLMCFWPRPQYALVFLNHQCFLYASVSRITCGLSNLFFWKSGDIPYFEVFDVNSLYWGNTAQRVCRHCWVLRVVFAQITLGLVYGMITVPTLGPIPAPRAFRNPFGRTPKSIVWAIRHWGGGCLLYTSDAADE